MAQTSAESVSPPGAPDAPALQTDSPPAPDPALPLDYADPWPDIVGPSSEAVHLVMWAVRRIILAGGFGLTAWGLANLVVSEKPHAASFALAWGVFFLVLMMPMRWRLRRPKRRRRRRGVAAARRSGI